MATKDTCSGSILKHLPRDVETLYRDTVHGELGASDDFLDWHDDTAILKHQIGRMAQNFVKIYIRSSPTQRLELMNNNECWDVFDRATMQSLSRYAISFEGHIEKKGLLLTTRWLRNADHIRASVFSDGGPEDEFYLDVMSALGVTGTLGAGRPLKTIVEARAKVNEIFSVVKFEFQPSSDTLRARSSPKAESESVVLAHNAVEQALSSYRREERNSWKGRLFEAKREILWLLNQDGHVKFDAGVVHIVPCTDDCALTRKINGVVENIDDLADARIARAVRLARFPHPPRAARLTHAPRRAHPAQPDEAEETEAETKDKKTTKRKTKVEEAENVKAETKTTKRKVKMEEEDEDVQYIKTKKAKKY